MSATIVKHFTLSLTTLCMVACTYVLLNPNSLIEVLNLKNSSEKKYFGYVLNTKNLVTRRHSDYLVWLKLSQNDRLYLYDRIFTSDNSFLNIQIASGSITVKPNTLLVLKEVSDQTIIEIDYGGIDLSLKPKKKIFIKNRQKIIPVFGPQASKTITHKFSSETFTFKRDLEKLPATSSNLNSNFFLKAPTQNQHHWLSPNTPLLFDLQLPGNQEGSFSILRHSDNLKILEKNITNSKKILQKFSQSGHYTAVYKNPSGILQLTDFSVFLDQPPKVIYPITGSQLDPNTKNINLLWQEVPLTQKYTVEISNDEHFEDIFYSQTLKESSFLLNLKETVDSFYWRVKVKQGDVPSKNWGQAQKVSFRKLENINLESQTLGTSIPETKSLQRKPSTVKPLKKMTNAYPTKFDKKIYSIKKIVHSPTEAFGIEIPTSWQTVAGASQYKIELIDSNKNKVLQSKILEKNQYTLKTKVRKNEKLLLRVSTENPISKKWIRDKNSTSSLVYKRILKLVPPTLNLPKDNSFIFSMANTKGHQVILNWSNVKFAQKYQVEIDTARNFKSPLYKHEVSQSAFSVSLKNEPSTFYWRVKAIHPQGQSPWSETFSFTLNN